MKIITDSEIRKLDISYKEAVDWARESFLLKLQAQLPHKISLSFNESGFINTMPCIVPSLDVYGVKIVSRYPKRTPSVDGDLLLYRFSTGELLSLMGAGWLTTLRTGAVAALAVQTFARKDFGDIAVMGLGQTGMATLNCLSSIYPDRELHFRCLRHKDHVEKTQQLMKKYPNVRISEGKTAEDIIKESDVVISCVTFSNSNFALDEAFRHGVTVVPVHTRGFQNCDLFFDKVYADDTSHVHQFRYFNQFQQFGELTDVLSGKIKGRENNMERILSYNIGIALHDMVFASKIYKSMDAL